MLPFEKINAGNYWLTKSMEFNKVKSAGTLWYLKKWITYYYFIFMKDNLFDSDYKMIASIFTNYIDSLPNDIRDKASEFFFEKDIRISGFMTFQKFIKNKPSFSNKNEEQLFLLKAKKFYFIYIMNIGGQAKYKALTLQLIQDGVGFIETLDKVKRKMLADGNNEDKFRQEIESDFHAAIRNERQIFFYYGFFHGREEASLNGFYNLTPVGRTVINANFHELVIVWEHQKIKMISQSPVSDIQNLKTTYSSDFFGVNYHPYFDLLKSIKELKVVNFSEYMFAISKSKTTFPIEEIIQTLKVNKINSLREYQKVANSFQRKADVEKEDFQKELKKYVLGIYEHESYKQDLGLNPYSSIGMSTNYEICIKNNAKFDFTFDLYSKITAYLDSQYLSSYREFEAELKRKYSFFLTGNRAFKLSNEIKYNWAKYIINFDENIINSLIYWSIACVEDNYNLDLTKKEIASHYSLFENLLKSDKSGKKDFIEIMESVQTNLRSDKIFTIQTQSYYLELEKTDPRKVYEDVKIDNLKVISNQTSSLDDTLKRKRNITLIQYMKSFYFTNYTNKESLVECEACKNVTFLTMGNTPYIEFHHLIPFSTDNGPDHYLNLFGLCPSCHRKIHFAKIESRTELYHLISDNNHLKKNLVERIEELYNEGFLEPIHLDFLLKENIISDSIFDSYMSRPLKVAS